MKINLFISLLLVAFVAFGQNPIEINYVKNQDNSVSFYYKKIVPGSYLVQVYFEELTNTRAANSETKVIRNSSGQLLTLKPERAENQIGFRFSYRYFKGDFNSKVRSNFPYILPFKKGKTVTPKELYSIENIHFNSELPKNWKAYSFDFTKEQMVKAIRKGVVVEIVNHYTADTLRKIDYYSKNNSITIEHKDGTVASYQGFDKNKIKVKLGEIVYPQSELGGLAKYDSRSLYRLYLTVFYYETVQGKSLQKIKSKDDYQVSYLTPNFFQNDDIIQVDSGVEYIVQYDKKTLFKEMKRRDIKKFKASQQLD